VALSTDLLPLVLESFARAVGGWLREFCCTAGAVCCAWRDAVAQTRPRLEEWGDLTWRVTDWKEAIKRVQTEGLCSPIFWCGCNVFSWQIRMVSDGEYLGLHLMVPECARKGLAWSYDADCRFGMDNLQPGMPPAQHFACRHRFSAEQSSDWGLSRMHRLVDLESKGFIVDGSVLQVTARVRVLVGRPRCGWVPANGVLHLAHELELSTACVVYPDQPEHLPTSWTCDCCHVFSCRMERNVQKRMWHCNRCSFDVCLVCRPAEFQDQDFWLQLTGQAAVAQ